MTRRNCTGCERVGAPCPRCDAEAEQRAQEKLGRSL